MIEFKVSKSTLANLQKALELKSAEVVEKTALKLYNSILMNEFPFYSGSFISSWRVGIGEMDKSFNAPADWGTKGPNVQYPVPSVKFDIGTVLPYQEVHVSNSAPHAYKVEYEGTKTSDYRPWMIAHHARTQAVMSYKFR